MNKRSRSTDDAIAALSKAIARTLVATEAARAERERTLAILRAGSLTELVRERDRLMALRS